MNSIWFQFGIAAILVVVAITLVAVFLRYKDSRSQWRMNSMLRRVGVDPEVIKSGNQKEIITAIRKRCKQCQTEDICERWLAGDIEGSNSFCPNMKVINSLAVKGDHIVLLDG